MEAGASPLGSSPCQPPTKAPAAPATPGWFFGKRSRVLLCQQLKLQNRH